MKKNYKPWIKAIILPAIFSCLSTQKSFSQSLALDLSATGNSVTIPSYTMDLSAGKAVTIQFDMKMNTVTQLNGAVCMTPSFSTTASPLVSYFWNGDNKFSTERGDGSSSTNAKSSINCANTLWHNYAIVLSGDSTLTYIDGVLVSTVYNTSPSYKTSFTGTLILGDRITGGINGNEFFDNFRVWTVKKSQQEIDSLRKICVDGNDPVLSILYTFEEGSGTTVYDFANADGQQNGTIVGTVAWTGGVLGRTSSFIYPVTCGDYTSPAGNTYSTSGLYTETILNSHNCDSTIYINLTVNNIVDQNVTAIPTSICKGDSSIINTASSENGIWYSLHNNSGGGQVGVSQLGDGSPLSFNTEALNSSSSYYVAAVDTNIKTIRKYLELDSSSFVVINHGADNYLGSYTVEAWLKPEDSTANIALLGSRWPSDFAFDLKLMSGNRIHGDIGNGSGWISTVADGFYDYTTGEWMHLAYVVDATTHRYDVYVNGIYIGGNILSSSTPFLFNSSRILAFGANSSNGGEPFKGGIDEVRIWNTVRTPSEILNNMNTQLTGSEIGLLMYFPCDDGAGTTVSDLGPNHYDGTLQYYKPTLWKQNIDTTICSMQMTALASVTVNTVDASATNNSPSLKANANGATYQWVDCATNTAISGASSQTYTATANGSYAVVVTQNGCSDTSACMTVGNVGLATNNMINFNLYPNPNNGNFTIQFGKKYESVSVEVFDISGRLIQTNKIMNQQETSLHLTTTLGIYLVQISTEEGTSQQVKVIVE